MSNRHQVSLKDVLEESSLFVFDNQPKGFALKVTSDDPLMRKTAKEVMEEHNRLRSIGHESPSHRVSSHTAIKGKNVVSGNVSVHISRKDVTFVDSATAMELAHFEHHLVETVQLVDSMLSIQTRTSLFVLHCGTNVRRASVMAHLLRSYSDLGNEGVEEDEQGSPFAPSPRRATLAPTDMSSISKTPTSRGVGDSSTFSLQLPSSSAKHVDYAGAIDILDHMVKMSSMPVQPSSPLPSEAESRLYLANSQRFQSAASTPSASAKAALEPVPLYDTYPDLKNRNVHRRHPGHPIDDFMDMTSPRRHAWMMGLTGQDKKQKSAASKLEDSLPLADATITSDAMAASVNVDATSFASLPSQQGPSEAASQKQAVLVNTAAVKGFDPKSLTTFSENQRQMLDFNTLLMPTIGQVQPAQDPQTTTRQRRVTMFRTNLPERLINPEVEKAVEAQIKADDDTRANRMQQMKAESDRRRAAAATESAARVSPKPEVAATASEAPAPSNVVDSAQKPTQAATPTKPATPVTPVPNPLPKAAPGPPPQSAPAPAAQPEVPRPVNAPPPPKKMPPPPPPKKLAPPPPTTLPTKPIEAIEVPTSTPAAPAETPVKTTAAPPPPRAPPPPPKLPPPPPPKLSSAGSSGGGMAAELARRMGISTDE